MKRVLRRALLPGVLLVLGFVLCVTAAAVPSPDSVRQRSACPSHTGALVTLDSLPEAVPGASKVPGRSKSARQLPLCVIVIGFSDLPYDTDCDWSDSIFLGDRSLSAYYSDMSFGNFTFVPMRETSAFGIDGNENRADLPNDGVIHITLPSAHDDWTLEGSGSRIRTMYRTMMRAFSDALLQADAMADFAAYDANGNGAIETNELAIGFVAAGYEAATDDGNYPLGAGKYLWSHAWSLRQGFAEADLELALPQPDGVAVSDYIAVAEQIEPGTMEPISVFAHELGHYLGLPDLYDTTYNSGGAWSRYEVGNLSVMANGIWGIDTDGSYTPYSMDPWCRCRLGWTEPTVLSETGNYTVAAQTYGSTEETAPFLRISTTREKEYYLVENRQFAKWDAGLADQYPMRETAAGGIVLWHIDESVFEENNNDETVNSADHRPAVMPLFPELSDGNLQMTGSGRVYPTRPFFDRTIWQTKYASSAGSYLTLPLYGTGSNANKRAFRTDSEKKICFLSDSAPVMTFELQGDDHILRLHEAVRPTCESAGMAAYWLCERCGRVFADPQAGQETALSALAVPATGHDWGDWVVEREPTETEQGLRVRVCRNDSSHRQTEVIPARGGTGENTCPLCGDVHKGFFGGFISFFHRFFFFLRNLFT